MTAALQNWPKEEWDAHLVNALEGRARSILTADNLPLRPNFEKVAKLLKVRFDTKALPKLSKATLETKERGTQENLTDLAYSILNMTIKAIPEIAISEIKKIAISYFMNALLYKVQRIHVRCYTSRNLEDALQKVIAYESAQTEKKIEESLDCGHDLSQ